MMSIHINMLVSISSEYGVSAIMGCVKCKSAIMIFDRHSNLKYKFGNRKFYAEVYYVSTVGINTVMKSKYIREQEKHDKIVDKTKYKRVRKTLWVLAKKSEHRAEQRVCHDLV